MPTNKTQTEQYPSVLYKNNIVTLPVSSSVFEEVAEEQSESNEDTQSTRVYLEELIAEHQLDCVHRHSALDFVDHTVQQSDGFIAEFTDEYIYLIVNRENVWQKENEWMPWNDEDKYLLETMYTREVLNVGRDRKSSWAVDGIDSTTHAGYIIPIETPLHSISMHSGIDAPAIEIAKQMNTLSVETVLPFELAECLVLIEVFHSNDVDNPVQETGELLGVGVSEIQSMLQETKIQFEQAQATADTLLEFDVIEKT